MQTKILIMEDAIFVREMEKKILINTEYTIIGESNSEEEGVELYKKHSPDLVIMDLQLAQGNGISSMRKIININADAKFIVTTSHSKMLEEEGKDLKENIKTVLHKPFTADELKLALRSN